METCNAVLSFESNENSNEISFTVLSHGTICFVLQDLEN